VELRNLITQFTYRIEPKPEGGFIAHASDPQVAPIEAATREEVQQRIQACIASQLAAQFPGLKLPLENQGLQFAFHIERKPGGGFALQSADPGAKTIEASTHEEIESHFVEKLMGFVGKHMMADLLSQALAAQAGSGDIKVVVNRKTGFGVNTETHKFGVGIGQDFTESGDGKTAGATLGSFSGGTISNAALTPQPGSSWKIFGWLLKLLAIAALAYFFFHRR
jgi:hypothetical protein